VLPDSVLACIYPTRILCESGGAEPHCKISWNCLRKSDWWKSFCGFTLWNGAMVRLSGLLVCMWASSSSVIWRWNTNVIINNRWYLEFYLNSLIKCMDIDTAGLHYTVDRYNMKSYITWSDQGPQFVESMRGNFYLRWDEICHWPIKCFEIIWTHFQFVIHM